MTEHTCEEDFVCLALHIVSESMEIGPTKQRTALLCLSPEEGARIYLKE
jgi:hypothetical protein